MAKFIQAKKSIDGNRVAINVDEIKLITEFEKIAGDEKTTKCVRVEIRGGYSIDVKTKFHIILDQMKEEQ